MAKVTIKIPHVVWRDGRPRFVPGPGVRKLGLQGQDLKKPDGCWLDLNETIAWSKAKCTEIAELRKPKEEDKPKTRRRKANLSGFLSLGELLVSWRKNQNVKAKQTGKPARKTREWYDNNIAVLEKYDPDLWLLPAISVTPVFAYNFYEKLRQDKGVHMSKAIISTIRPAYAWGVLKGYVKINPFGNLRVQTPPPRVRVGSIEEMKHLIATADKEGRADIGDAILLGLCTAQRQNDRLLLKLEKRIEGYFLFRQSKTGVIVQIPEIPDLIKRQQQAMERRTRAQKQIPQFLINEKQSRKWGADGDTYRKAFRKICDKATETMPSLKGFRDQDLRDTSVTWLANAGCTVPEISSITGHSIENANKILRHYLAQTPEQANSAIGKLTSYLQEKGGLL
ncbi:tyrosine-type recombinase/integrase [Cohaesibacter gelatinilyticus]|uniref:Phage integrase family protein n=1 Tax=Cohaesibacter gelatinilyticus TaxID=372072 RepID=A0A285PI26_9HYPH|nr:tyrosine-type recombinase/integrase [Cohaesibacter gelatinilyticus]SNZ20923.1 Phage integrase family protein [Cohaesibacter gelatinilyticus]